MALFDKLKSVFKLAPEAAPAAAAAELLEEERAERKREERQEEAERSRFYGGLGRDKNNHTLRHIFIFLIIIFLVIYLIYFVFFTSLGSSLRGEAGVGGVQFTESLRGLTGPLRLTQQILTGQYDPTNLWSSDQVRSQYADVKDVGVVLTSVEPLRAVFDVNQELIISGRINAIAFPGQEVTATMSSCTKEISGIVEICNPAGWICNPSSLSVREIRNRVFSCAHPALQKEALPLAVEVAATAIGTQTVGGKQMVYSPADVLISVEGDPLDKFGIDQQLLTSWQTGDESVNVAINVAGQPDVLETEIEHFLGVRVENPPLHTGVTQLKEIQMLLPTPPITIVAPEDFSCTSDSSAVTAALKEFGIRDPPEGQTFTLCTASVSGTTLNPAEDIVRFVRVKIPDSALQQGQEFNTFFVLAKANYDYANLKTIPLRVKALGQP